MNTFARPRDDRYFEDYPLGAVYAFGPVSVTEAEIIEFARRYDPQPMHVDPEAAERGPFQGVIASGWHTVGIMVRLLVDNYVSAVASLASPGVDEVRWRQPVRPGDELVLHVTTLETRVSRSKPDRGLVTSRLEAFDRRGELVASMKTMNLVSLRNPP